MADRYDVIVIGGGHAGAEAANAAARAGARTLLLTQNLDTIGQMSCNPAIGGIAKGTVVREVDALGGIMGRATDRASIQFRMLNRSKGPAVWAPRAQCDRGLYRRAVRSLLERQARLEFRTGTVAGLLLERETVAGVETACGSRLLARAVVVTAGTFLRGRIHVGVETRVPAGRAGEPPSVQLSQSLERQGLTVGRFKTGTPPRIDGRSVDLAAMSRQDGDAEPYWFSFFERHQHPAQLPCWLAWTGAPLKEIIQRHLGESALYGGAIAARGPRYCPSIEDKIVKFPDAERHQVFLEPEGLDTTEMYVNGLSTSLPPAVQERFLRAVPGLGRVRMTRPGYAIEYDYFPPTQLSQTLESRAIPGLFFAGQVNGTTGYEEAAGQGVVAGVNAAALALETDPLVLGRDQAFIGVMVDDLVSRGVDEPYRLFTSRSEFRLLLRQDNALGRLLPIAERYQLLDEHELVHGHARLNLEERLISVSRETTVSPEQAEPLLQCARTGALVDGRRIAELVRRPGVELAGLFQAVGIDLPDEPFLRDALHSAETELKYVGYIERERAAAARLAEMSDFRLPDALPFESLTGVSREAREQLAARRPATLGQAGRIPGVSPSDLQNLVLAVLRSGQCVSRETSGSRPRTADRIPDTQA
jgi:tRNA uridine 5-carboxymethylaminomethyl modification enzyme